MGCSCSKKITSDNIIDLIYENKNEINQIQKNINITNEQITHTQNIFKKEEENDKKLADELIVLLKNKKLLTIKLTSRDNLDKIHNLLQKLDDNIDKTKINIYNDIERTDDVRIQLNDLTYQIKKLKKNLQKKINNRQNLVSKLKCLIKKNPQNKNLINFLKYQ